MEKKSTFHIFSFVTVMIIVLSTFYFLNSEIEPDKFAVAAPKKPIQKHTMTKGIPYRVPAQLTFPPANRPKILRKSIGPNRFSRKAISKISKYGSKFSHHNSEYSILENVYPIPIRESGKYSYDKELFRENGVIYVTSESPIEGLKYKSVYNPKSGRVGLMTGTIKVKLSNYDDYEEISSEFGIEFISGYRHLDWAYFRMPDFSLAQNLATKLQADSRTHEVVVEVLEGSVKPN